MKFKRIMVLAVAVLLLIGGFSLRGILRGGEERIRNIIYTCGSF